MVGACRREADAAAASRLEDEAAQVPDGILAAGERCRIRCGGASAIPLHGGDGVDGAQHGGHGGVTGGAGTGEVVFDEVVSHQQESRRRFGSLDVAPEPVQILGCAGRQRDGADRRGRDLDAVAVAVALRHVGTLGVLVEHPHVLGDGLSQRGDAARSLLCGEAPARRA